MKNEQQPDSFDIMNFIDWQNKRENYSIHPQESSQPPQSASRSKKISYKNKYLNKVKESFGGISTSVRPRQQFQVEPSQDLPVDKKDRNKVAAKESRDRKKIYIQIIEKQTRNLQEQLRKVNLQLQEYKNQIRKARLSNQNIVGASIAAQMQQIVKKLRKLVTQQDSYEVDSDINLVLDSISFRFALLGRQRFSKINWGYDQILEIGIPLFHRYLLWSAKKGCHFFANENTKSEQQEWFDQMRPIIGDAMEKNKQKFKILQQKFIAEKNMVQQIVKNFMKKRQQMVNLSKDVDQLQHIMRTLYTPKQIAKLILFNIGLSQRQELRYIQNICYEDEDEIEFGYPKKKIKMEEK